MPPDATTAPDQTLAALNGEGLDDALMLRIAAGDTAAWPWLLERHLSAIVACAWRILGDRAEAEDVAQDTFLRLLDKAPQWQSGGPPLRAWLHRVAVNLCIDRRRARRLVPLEDVTVSEHLLADTTQVDRDGTLTRTLLRALFALPERQRVAVTLVHHEGYSNREAAEMLAVSVHALESLLARARRTLRAQLDPVARDLFGDAQ